MRTRKIAAALLSAMMVLTAFPAASGAAETETEFLDYGVQSDEEQTEQNGNISISEADYTWYIADPNTSFEMPVYFLNDVKDLPYVNLSDWTNVMVTIYSGYLGQQDYGLSLETDGHVAQLTRENGYTMMFDFQEGTILFDDYDGFIHSPQDTSLLDMVSLDYHDDKGDALVLERIERGSFDRYGTEVELCLNDYDITICWNEADGLYLVPLQTLSDFCLALNTAMGAFFNGEAVYLASAGDLGVGNEELNALGESLYSAPVSEMSEALAWYNYCELCLALDQLYGLKEIHDIRSFDRIFKETGYRKDLCSTDPNVVNGALNDFIYYYLDDLHSGFIFASYRTTGLESIGGSGLASERDAVNAEIFSGARESAGQEIPTYQEVGNTAYITFDHFTVNIDPSVYYELGTDPEMDTDPSSEMVDTIALIIDAHEKITRKNSPIENVVIDLSLNGGGQLDACMFVASWFLGESAASVRSSMTGAVSTGKYRVDTNLDGEFDEKDTVSDKNLYCLIGPYSFSCGNLLPNIFRSSNRVTLLGQTSGGGSCSVLPMTTAEGAIFRISSPYRMSYMKNGSYYDTDLGVNPDFVISKPANFYDREALTDYINRLF